MGKRKSPDLDSLSVGDSEDDLNDIFDMFGDEVDTIGYLQDEVSAKILNAIRAIDPDCADELENAIYYAISGERFGTGWSAHIKSKIIRPIQRKYRK